MLSARLTRDSFRSWFVFDKHLNRFARADPKSVSLLMPRARARRALPSREVLPSEPFARRNAPDAVYLTELIMHRRSSRNCALSRNRAADGL